MTIAPDMSITIRQAAIADATAINRLSAQLGYTIPIAQTEVNILALADNPHSAIFVAEEDGQVTGWLQVCYKLYLETGPFCEIVGLVVDEQQRGKGIGTQLVTKAKEWAQQTNARALKVRTNVKRADAHRFYEREGFSCMKEQKVFLMKL